MRNKSLLDTDIFSEIRKGKNSKVIAKAIAYKAVFKKYTISVITVSEVVKGWRKLNRCDRIQEFLTDLSQIEVLNLDQKSAELSGLINGIKRGDSCHLGNLSCESSLFSFLEGCDRA